MGADEVEKTNTGTASAPNNTIDAAEVSAVVPDPQEDDGKEAEPSTTTTTTTTSAPPTTSLPASGDAATIAASNAGVTGTDTVAPPATSAPTTAPVTAIPVSSTANTADTATPATASASAANTSEPVPTVTEEKKSEKEKDDIKEDKKETAVDKLWEIVQAHNYKEIWGVTLADPTNHVPSQIILQKYLNANDGDLVKGKEQLKATLDWRAKTNPLELVKKSFSKDKFEGLGYITTYEGDSNSPNGKEVFTWNIYGSVKDIEKTFGDLDAFIDWRVALMEMAMHELNIGAATKPITAEDDPYKMYQVHDYKGTSFFRSPPQVRSAAKKTVEILATAYPETLKEKFFVNVPAIMGFMYGIMKVFVAPKTLKKFHPMSNGTAMVHEFAAVQGLGEKLPTEYGGKGEVLTAKATQPVLG